MGTEVAAEEQKPPRKPAAEQVADAVEAYVEARIGLILKERGLLGLADAAVHVAPQIAAVDAAREELRRTLIGFGVATAASGAARARHQRRFE